MFFSSPKNRVHVLDAPATDKKPAAGAFVPRSVSMMFQGRKSSFRLSFSRIFHPKQSKSVSFAVSSQTDGTDTPCLSTSTSSSSVQSSVSFSRRAPVRPHPAQRSSKSIELESLIVEYPSRTVRVSLTPICAA